MEIESSQSSKQDILSFFKTFPIVPSHNPSYSRPMPSQYKNLSSKFLIPDQKNFSTQYCHFYYVRLMTMKPYMTSNLLSMNYNPISILKLPKDELCCVIGVLYKEMKLKPSILQRIGGALDNNTFSQITTFDSADDMLYIEDENGKVKIDLSESNEKMKDLCSGLVVGLSGFYDGKIFKVKEMIFPGMNILKQQPNLSSISDYFKGINNDDKFVALISGLNIDGSQKKMDYHINWLKQLLYGNMNNDQLVKIISRICRVVIAGNSIKKEGFMADNFSFVGAAKAQELYNKANTEIKVSITILDEFLQELTKNLPVDILSGDNEPNTHFYPYQPMSKLFFERTYQNKHFNAVTNPYYFDLDGRKILGTSGINIHDLRKSGFQEKSDLDLLETTLKWGHLVPTAPETIRYIFISK